jgi:hypothetical protein
VSFRGVNSDLTIDLISRDRPDGKRPHEVRSASGSTINWSGNVIDSVGGGLGDDRIFGNADSNTISLGAALSNGGPPEESGDAAAFARRGDDDVLAYDFDKGDFVDCGEGNYTVYYDRGDVVKNCEVRLNEPFEP